MGLDKAKRNAYMAEYMKRQYRSNLEYVRQLKLSRGCTDCGYNEHHAGLEFDHIEPRNGDQSKTISKMVARTRRVLDEELDKCEVVCATCHNIREWNRQQLKID